jgi:hypothetical protein
MKKVGGAISFTTAVKKARAKLKDAKFSDINSAAKLALREVRGIKKKKLNRIIPIPKTGGILPLIPIFAGLSALGALASGTASVVNAIKKTRDAQAQLKENLRHNQMMESIAMGKGLYLKPYRKGLGLFLSSPNKKKKIQPLSNIDLIKYAKDLNISNFRGVFSSDTLPLRIRLNEKGIINTEGVKKGPGKHWVCYSKRGDEILYYDSYGNLRPSLKTIEYFKSGGKNIKIKYNYSRDQPDNTNICGHLCLLFLLRN